MDPSRKIGIGIQRAHYSFLAEDKKYIYILFVHLFEIEINKKLA